MTPQITPRVTAVYRHFGSRKLFAEHLYLCYGLYNRAPLVSIKSGISIGHRASLNPKSEYRNPKQIRITKIPMIQTLDKFL
jgi:hypothetical protein